MRFHISLSILSIVVPTIGCGQKDASPASAATDQSSEVNWSLAVQTDANLPLCNPTSDGRLVYIKSTTQFMACTSGNWSPIDMKAALGNVPPVGLAVASTWRHNYSGPTGSAASGQIIGQTGRFILWLTDIELQQFTNGAAFVTVSGVRFATTVNDDDWYDEHWSHSFFLAPSSGNQVITRKFGGVANTLFQFQVELAAVPIFKAAVTYNGTPLVSVKSFSLTKK